MSPLCDVSSWIHCLTINVPVNRYAEDLFHCVVLIPFKSEPRHEVSNNVVGTTSKASDQPAHTRSLIRAFASRLNIL